MLIHFYSQICVLQLYVSGTCDNIKDDKLNVTLGVDFCGDRLLLYYGRPYRQIQRTT